MCDECSSITGVTAKLEMTEQPLWPLVLPAMVSSSIVIILGRGTNQGLLGIIL